MRAVLTTVAVAYARFAKGCKRLKHVKEKVHDLMVMSRWEQARSSSYAICEMACRTKRRG
jgi:hypothetical protein